MNRFVALCLSMVLFGGLFSAQAQTTTNTVTDGRVIPDGSFTGLTSSQNLSFAPGTTIGDIQVTLNITGGWNGDLFGYLFHNGQYVVLLNRIGSTSGNLAGQSGAGMNVIFSDLGADIHTATGSIPLTGTWAPDGRNTFPSLTLNTDPRSSTPLADAFLGTDPNGTWTLFLADVDFGQQGTLQNWGLIISAVPEPSTIALLALGGLTLAGCLRRRKL